MTVRAHGQMLFGADTIGLLERKAARDLVLRWPPLHVEDAVDGAQEFFGRAMAFEAPLHVERGHAPGQRHGVDRAVAGRAANALAATPWFDAAVLVEGILNLCCCISFETLAKPLLLNESKVLQTVLLQQVVVELEHWNLILRPVSF